MNLTIEQVKTNGWLVLEGIVGSQAYGLATEQSDTDIKGVYILPKDIYYGLDYFPQANNETNDIVYYELNRFMELVGKNNPNILELLYLPKSCILYKHPVFDIIDSRNYLSKLCKDTFANYAITQIRKARGLNKKIVNPMDKERKSILDFCYVAVGQNTTALTSWLKQNGLTQEDCGLVNLPHMRDMFALYHSTQGLYKGIMGSPLANEVSVSSVPKNEESIAIMSFNKDGYSKYCKDYKEYWDWVEKRNDARYETNLAHGREYDAKNMMHTFRLLEMATEIGETGKLNVQRPNRNFLLDVKLGNYEFEALMELAEDKIADVEKAFANTSLPDEPDVSLINEILVDVRDSWYLKK